MDRGNEGFPNNNDNLFADTQQYNAYENMNFVNGTEPAFSNSAWPIPEYQSRANPPSYGLQQNGGHLTSTNAHPNYNGHASPYGQSTNHSPVPFNQNAFANFGGQQNFPYRQPPQYDPSLIQTVNHGQSFGSSGTIAPQALEHETSPYGNPYAGSNFLSTIFNGQPRPNRPVAAAPPPQQRPVDQRALAASVPHGIEAGIFSIIKFDDLAGATKSERMGNFVNVGSEALEWDCTRSAIPAYTARKSRNELRALAGNNTGLLAKIGKRSMKHRSLSASSKAIKTPNASSSVLGAQIKYEQISSSEEDSSEDDDSAYSDDDDQDSPLPDKRPEDSKGAVEYDTIKALWRSKRKVIDGSIVRQSLTEFWEVVKTIRDRWKADIAAVTEAEEKKRVGELPLLKSRVKDQRDMLETAFRTALKHGHRDIIALLAENVSLIFVCYQLLLDRFKNDDCNSGVSKAILETMLNFTTLTEEKAEKTQLSKILPRYLKKADVRVQFWVKKILANTAQASKEAALKGDQKKADASSATHPASPTTKRAVPDPVAGVKRAAATPGEGSAPKKTATGPGKTNIIAPTAKVNGVAKKSASTGDSKPASAPGSVAAVRKAVTARPSGYFSSLQSASKKPGTSIADRNVTTTGKTPAVSRPLNKPTPVATAPKPAFSFAETMANLGKTKEEKPSTKPQKEEKPESVEERKKRLHKEERRKLRVRFAERDQLEQIRIFQSDPNEESGHDSSQLRDMSDIGGEGRVLKQHRDMMDIDEEDETTDEAEKLIDWYTPSPVDFSVVPADERARNYVPFGGGELPPETPERVVRQNYERHTLLVFYADSNEVPPNPREPSDPFNGEIGGETKEFGAPEEKFAVRARMMRAQQLARHPQHGKQTDTDTLNVSAFSGSVNIQPQQQHVPQGAPDIQSILASLQAQGGYAQPQQAGPSFQQPYVNGLSANSFQSAPPPAQQPPAGIDLAAILAAINPQQQNGYNAAAAPSTNYAQQPQQQQPQMFASTGTNFAQHDPAQNPFYKTKVCKFFSEGRCTKGDKCSYLHE